jgi:hypothetical protein
LHDDIAASDAANADLNKFMNALTVLTDVGSSTADGFDNQPLKAGLEVANKSLNFLSSKIGYNENRPTILMGAQKLTGSVTFNSKLNGIDINIATPASLNASASNCPEFRTNYETVNGISQPSQRAIYPMYNELLGLFAFVHKPTFIQKIYNSHNDNGQDDGTNYGGDSVYQKVTFSKSSGDNVMSG